MSDHDDPIGTSGLEQPIDKMNSNDPDHFFQTSHSLAETFRKKLKSTNNNGTPIRLQSKILAVITDPADAHAIYIAESAGTARRLVLDNPGKTTHIYRGPTTPLTSLALSSTSQDTILYSGSWEKSIWSWSTSSRTQRRRYFGHTDFITALQILPHANRQDYLISGSSDASIIIWAASTGEKLHTLRGHTRGILDLAIDPFSYDTSTSATPITLFSAGSDREIRRWRIDDSANISRVVEIEPDEPIIQHETSVYALRFDNDDDLWTASADGTAKCLSRERGWTADTTLQHGDYVRAVAIDERGGWVVTAGRDEDVKVWDKASGKLHHVYEGHFEEVTGLVVVRQVVVSVGIDATVRQWSLTAEGLGKAVREAEDARNGVEMETEEVPKPKVGGLTEEEERELEDLMGDSE